MGYSRISCATNSRSFVGASGFISSPSAPALQAGAYGRAASADDFFISCDRSISDRILAPLSAAPEPFLIINAAAELVDLGRDHRDGEQHGDHDNDAKTEGDRFTHDTPRSVGAGCVHNKKPALSEAGLSFLSL
jgi:hypothetical protein